MMDLSKIFFFLPLFFFFFQISFGRVPIFVMLPLDTVNNNNQLNNYGQLSQNFEQLKSGGVDGVMTDVWWGLVEKSGPKQYNWTAYEQLVQLVQQKQLKLQVVMSFHQCGGNVGDACNVPLPPWVLQVGNSNPDIFYTDREGHRDKEYLSLGVDHEPVFQGRSAVDIYADYMTSFSQTFGKYFGSVITEIQVGLGPAGEMRYPSYQLQYWNFPGVGEFQCYDKYMLQMLKDAASKVGHSEWGNGGPDNAGNYNSNPQSTGFFNNGFDNYASAYGQFFLTWYSSTLIKHGEDILQRAAKIFGGQRVNLAAKVSGIHWLYKTPSHAAELTAGYKNDKGKAYQPIASMFAKYNVTFDFTCLEMRDNEQPYSCACGPEELVGQTLSAAKNAGIHYSGENALPRYDQTAYNTIEYESKRVMLIEGFTYLRLNPTLLSGNNWNTFKNFVQTMHNLN